MLLKNKASGYQFDETFYDENKMTFFSLIFNSKFNLNPSTAKDSKGDAMRKKAEELK